jgi:hypothetical protein
MSGRVLEHYGIAEAEDISRPVRRPVTRHGVACVAILLAAVWFLPASAAAQEAAKEAKIPWNEDTQDPTLISMGPIGARAKTDRLVRNSSDSLSNSGTIKSSGSIEPGT